jgi:hypothetical protein
MESFKILFPMDEDEAPGLIVVARGGQMGAAGQVPDQIRGDVRGREGSVSASGFDGFEDVHGSLLQ